MQVTRGIWCMHKQSVPGFLSSTPTPTRAWERGHFSPILGSSTSRDTSTIQICSNWLIASSVTTPISVPPSPTSDENAVITVRWWMVQSKKKGSNTESYSLYCTWVAALNLLLFYTYNIIIVYLFLQFMALFKQLIWSWMKEPHRK